MRVDKQNSIKGLEITTATTLEEIEKIRSIWQKMQKAQLLPVINADIDRYLSVLEAFNGDLKPYVMLVKEDGQAVAMLIGLVQDCQVKCSIGRKTLFKPVLRELRVVYGGVIGKDTNEIYRLLLRELMVVLGSGEADMVSFNHLRTDCRLYKLARKIPGLLCRGHLSKIEPHWSMSVPGDIDLFYQARSSKHRKHLKQYIRKLERTYPDQVKMITYRKEDELDEAIKTASQISAKTYQNAMGGGFVDDFRARTLLSAAAKLGWFRGHILYIDEQPCAYRFALQHGRTYFADGIGFDPKWSKFRVGTVLFLKVIKNLCRDGVIDYYDFGFGDADYKRSYSDKQWGEASVYIFAPRFFPVSVNLVRSLTSGISFVVQYLVTKLGILNFVQRYRRRRVLRKSSG